MRLLMNPIYAIVLFLFLLKISIYMTKIGIALGNQVKLPKMVVCRIAIQL